MNRWKRRNAAERLPAAGRWTNGMDKRLRRPVDRYATCLTTALTTLPTAAHTHLQLDFNVLNNRVPYGVTLRGLYKEGAL